MKKNEPVYAQALTDADRVVEAINRMTDVLKGLVKTNKPRKRKKK